jgi:hypothetical protein
MGPQIMATGSSAAKADEQGCVRSLQVFSRPYISRAGAFLVHSRSSMLPGWSADTNMEEGEDASTGILLLLALASALGQEPFLGDAETENEDVTLMTRLGGKQQVLAESPAVIRGGYEGRRSRPSFVAHRVVAKTRDKSCRRLTRTRGFGGISSIGGEGSNAAPFGQSRPHFVRTHRNMRSA